MSAYRSVAGLVRTGRYGVLPLARFPVPEAVLVQQWTYAPSINHGRRKKREKKRENLKIRRHSPSTIPILRPQGEEASTRLENKLRRHRRGFAGTFLLPVQVSWGARASRQGFTGTFLLPARTSREEDVSSPCVGEEMSPHRYARAYRSVHSYHTILS
ncbi:hypothetical protein BHM03_00000549 [Ensete ventricosum]|nr:hypothetical protein BHM03_00000549 [Ensete ventricosum]